MQTCFLIFSKSTFFHLRPSLIKQTVNPALTQSIELYQLKFACLVVALINMEAKIIFIGPACIPLVPKVGGHCPSTRPGCAAHGGNPPSSAGLRPHGSCRTGEIRVPVLLETLALVRFDIYIVKIYDFWKYMKMQKFQKLEKEYYSNWTDSKIILGPETDENEIQNLQVLRTKHLKQYFPGFCSC